MINLHYASIDQWMSETDIEKLKFKTSKALQRWLTLNIACERPYGIVYLLTTNSDENESNTDIFIFEKSYKVVSLFKNIEAHLNSLHQKDVFLQEYKTYEDAYAVALDMREGNALCYNDENNN